jgi:site-specific recombinase XerD
MASLTQFLGWLDVPIEKASPRTLSQYIDALMAKGLKPKTINCHLQRIREFYHYLIQEEGVPIANPVRKGYSLRTPKPLPKHLRQEELEVLFGSLRSPRDRAMFTLMLRCGLRVGEVTGLTLGAIDLVGRRLIIYDAKWGKDRVVYLSDDATSALGAYLVVRPQSKSQRVFLNQKGPFRGRPLSSRGIRKRMEYYAKKTGLRVSCHALRHTMATQMLEADAQLVTIQDLLGHSWITTTQRYCRVSNRKVQRDYYTAMQKVMQRTEYHQFLA